MAGASSSPLDVLYVHPSGHLNDLVIPAGALSVMNSVAVPKLGRYAFEVTDEELAGARVIALDFHWGISYGGLSRLVDHIRRVAPGRPLVVGGISAGMFGPLLVDRLGVDAVLRGDAEVAFVEVVERLLRGRSVDGLPNVVTAHTRQPELTRMSQEAFDATDCLTVDWFPTYAKVTDWESEAFSQGRTIPVSRGCPMRCRACYGSYASSHGDGYLLRTPARVVEELHRAVALGVRNLRLILAKPPRSYLDELVEAIARGGPYQLDSTVGLYLCASPSEAHMAPLSAAFPQGLAISMVPPEEHEPPLTDRQAAKELEAWRQLVGVVGSLPTVHLDAWVTRGTEVARLEAALGTRAVPNATVSLGVVWNMTRPRTMDDADLLDELAALSDDLWTFYAGKLLSPALAELLAPFRFLDEVWEDPTSGREVDPALEEIWRIVLGSWERHKLPVVPGLVVSVAPARLDGSERLPRHVHGIRAVGSVGIARRARLIEEAAPLDLAVSARYHGVELTATITPGPEADALAVLIDLEGARPVARHGHGRLAARGLVVLPLPPQLVMGGEAVTVRLVSRVQEIATSLVDARGRTVTRGRLHLGYFRDPAARPRGERGQPRHHRGGGSSKGATPPTNDRGRQ